MNAKQTLIAIQMSTDSRLPRSAFGYVYDLTPESSPAIVADRLKILSLYIPELVEEYKAAAE